LLTFCRHFPEGPRLEHPLSLRQIGMPPPLVSQVSGSIDNLQIPLYSVGNSIMDFV